GTKRWEFNTSCYRRKTAFRNHRFSRTRVTWSIEPDERNSVVTKPFPVLVAFRLSAVLNCSHNGGLVPESNHRWANSLNRRNALRALAGVLAGSPLLRAQQDPFRDHTRIPGLNELVTSFDFEPVAYAKVQRYNYDYMAYGTDSEFT